MVRLVLDLLLRSFNSGGALSGGLFRSGWMLPMILGAAAGVAGTYHFMKPPETQHGVTPVRKGVLYRGGQLSPEQLAEEIRQRGIKTVINFASPDEREKATCRKLGVRYLEMPVGDVWCMCGKKAPGQEQAGKPYDLSPLWQLLDDPAARPVLIHCQGGVHRTGVATALFRMRYQGWQPTDALAEMDLYGFDSRKPKFDNVKDYLRSYPNQVRTARSRHGRY